MNPVVRDGCTHYTVPLVGGESRDVLFRVPDIEDIARLDLTYPLLDVDEHLEAAAEVNAEDALKKILDDPAASIRLSERVNKLLVQTAKSPKMSLEPVEGEINPRSVRLQDRLFVFTTLMMLGGFNDEAAADIVPFADSEDSSKPPTPSPGDTASGLTKSADSVAAGTTSSE